MNLVKVNSYSFIVRHIADNSENYKTSETFRVVNKVTPILFDCNDILSVTCSELGLVNLTDYKLSKSSYDTYVFKVGLNQRGVSLVPNNTTDPYAEKYKVVVSDKILSKRKFYNVTLKHAVMTGLGLNGTSYDQCLIIDEESWEHLREQIEGDNEL